MLRWARTIFVLLLLLVPGGFLVLLGLAVARAFLNRKRALSETKDTQPRLGEVLAQMRPRDVFRELRATL
jgi:hypothetical protein